MRDDQREHVVVTSLPFHILDDDMGLPVRDKAEQGT
jgi:hypothetical protein